MYAAASCEAACMSTSIQRRALPRSPCTASRHALHAVVTHHHTTATRGLHDCSRSRAWTSEHYGPVATTPRQLADYTIVTEAGPGQANTTQKPGLDKRTLRSGSHHTTATRGLHDCNRSRTWTSEHYGPVATTPRQLADDACRGGAATVESTTVPLNVSKWYY
ncbi:hypothetical protein J6590_003572 [Homalodisca vitripennis]|nr:hypothetical protein J6590_003572 [Homalodisca vitripennis]